MYLDSAATSLTPEQVLAAMDSYYREYGVNIHRGVYEFSERASRHFEDVRTKVIRHLGLAGRDANENHPDPRQEVIFTRGSTESSNIVAYCWGRAFLGEGDEILTTELEHHSTLVPWHPVAQKTGATFKFVPVAADGTYSLEDFVACMGPRTKVAVFSGMSNVTGFTPPIREMLAAARKRGIVTVVDGAQFVSHSPVSIPELEPDFLYFSAHKMLGPTGVGVLYGRKALLDNMEPFLYGGDMIQAVHRDWSTYHALPEKFEAGTPNIAGVLGFGAALDYLNAVGMANVHRHETELLSYAFETLHRIPEFLPVGPGDPARQGGILSFNLRGIHSHDTGAVLDTQGVAVRTGVHCAQPAMEKLGISGTVRASLYLYSRESDIDALARAIQGALSVFG